MDTPRALKQAVKSAPEHVSNGILEQEECSMSTEQTLSPHEAACLLAFTSADEEIALPELAWRSELQVAQARSAIERLKLRNAGCFPKLESSSSLSSLLRPIGL